LKCAHDGMCGFADMWRVAGLPCSLLTGHCMVALQGVILVCMGEALGWFGLGMPVQALCVE
jgi:hypothetical protein